MPVQKARAPIRRFSEAAKAQMAEETKRAAMEATGAATEARETKTARLRAARMAAETVATPDGKLYVDRLR